MVFLAHIVLVLALMALAVGTGFVIWGMRNQGKGVALAKIVGIIIIILSIIIFLYILIVSHQQMRMMHRMMMNCPMMQSQTQSNPADHLSHQYGPTTPSVPASHPQ